MNNTFTGWTDEDETRVSDWLAGGDPVPVIEDAPVRKSGQRRVGPKEVTQ